MNMHMDQHFKIRQMTPEDFDTVIAWCDEEHWNVSKSDLESHYAVDPRGFFIGEYDGVIAASASALTFQDYAHIGFYIVHKDYRGRRLGKMMFERLLEYTKNTKTVALDSVVPQKEQYERAGFKVHELVHKYKKRARGGKLNPELVNLKEMDFEKLVEYDQKAFGDSRRIILKSFLERKDTVAYGVVEEGEMKGYGILRKSQTGYRIGPLVVDEKRVAEEIIEGLQSFVPGKEVVLDVFENSERVIEVMKEQGWTYSSYFYRMYLNGKVGNIDTQTACGALLEAG